MNKKNWSVYIAYLAIIAFFVTVGIIAGFLLLDRIAQETDAHASLFGEWWQVLLFVLDVIILLAIVFCIVMILINKKKSLSISNEKYENKLLKIISPSTSGVFVTFFAILFTIFSVGQIFAYEYEDNINYGLGIDPYTTITNSSSDSEYFKSDYIKKDEIGNPVYVIEESGYKHQVYDDEAMRKNSLYVSEKAADEGTVLMWNNSSALPLEKGAKLSIFGVAQKKNNYLFTGSGSGGMLEIKYDDFPNLKEELERLDENNNQYYQVNPILWDYYTNNGGGRLTKTPDIELDKHYHTMTINEKPWNQVSKNTTSSFSDYNDAAIMIISRNGGEDMDTWFDTDECLDNDYLDLSFNEKEILDNLVSLKKSGVFKKIILLINACNAIQMKNILSFEDIDACINVGTGGLTSFKTIFNILSGKVNPSGHLVDTYAYDNESSPASINTGAFQYTRLGNNFLPDNRNSNEYNNAYIVYQEGIYVGYRYYETRYEDYVMNKGNASSSKGVVAGNGSWKYENEVAFPFGHGLSYTTFDYDLIDVNERTENNKKIYDIKVQVSNTGKVAGKTAVQIYLQKPYTQYDIQNKIEKSSIELVGYTKTNTLEPNAQEVYTVSVDEYEFKSYDSYNKKTYILEKGDYYLSTGSDAHDALNNILSAKGYSKDNGMVDYLGKPTDGNSSLVYKITVEKDDFEKYSTSPTGYKVTNQFNNADRNIYEGTKDQPLTYLSRNNWDATYPTSYALMKATNPRLIEDMNYNIFDQSLNDSSAVMPVYDAKNGTTLATLRGADFNASQWEKLLDNLTWEETKELLGQAVHIIKSATSVNSPSPLSYDGPAGIKIVNPTLGTQMAFPQSVLLAQSMNDELVEEVYKAFSHEMLHAGIGQVYGTAANIHRSAYSGRNWEYISEDGFISGKILSAEVKGLQSKGAIVNIKHFVLNDQEIYRCGISTWANEQSIREIYLKAFEAGITEGKANGVMSSLNRLGVEWAGAHYGLLTEVLRNEWGFNGLVETDSAVGAYMKKGSASAEAVIAGNNLWLTGGGCNFDDYKDNPTVCQAMRERAHEVLYVLVNSASMNGFDSDTLIVKITPWYFNVITIVQVTSGVLLGLSIILLIYLLISKRREYCKHHDIQKEKEEKELLQKQRKSDQKQYNSEIISITRSQRNKFYVVFIGIVTALVLGFVSTSILLNNKIDELSSKLENGNFENNQNSLSSTPENPSNDTPPSESHTCETKCPTCGYCLDMDCFEPSCGTKCGDNSRNTLLLEASHYYVAKSDDVIYDKDTNLVTLSHSSTLLYQINVSESITASLSINIISSNETLISDLLTIKTNNTIFNSNIKTKAISGSLQEVVLGCITLNNGVNLIELNSKNNVTLSGLKLYHNANSITLEEAPGAEHICQSVCSWDNCDGCKNYECEHPNCENKCPHLDNEFKAIDTKTILTGPSTKNKSEDCIGSSSKGLVSIEFPLHANKATKSKIFVTISSNSKTYNFSDMYGFYINDVLQTTNAKTPIGQQFYDYTEIELGIYDLKLGTNIIKFTIDKSQSGIQAFNFRALNIQTEATIDWAELECSSICGFCNGCTDKACTHDVCSTKCSCYSTTLSVLDNFVKVINQTKNTKQECVAVKRDILVEIIYTLESSADTVAEISFTTCTWSSERNLIQESVEDEDTIHVYDFYINNNEVFSSAKTTICSSPQEDIQKDKYNEYVTTNVGLFNLKQGKNELKLTVFFDGTEKHNINLNFRSMGIRVSCGAEINWISSFDN